MHESEKWKWSHWVVSNSQWPHGRHPTRLLHPWDFPGKSTGVGCHFLLHVIVYKLLKNSPAMRETWVWSLRWEDPLEKGMATHSSIPVQRIPMEEEPGGLQSIRSQRDMTEQLTIYFLTKSWIIEYLYLISDGEGNGNPLQYSCLENPMDRGTCQAMVLGVTKPWTWLSN